MSSHFHGPETSCPYSFLVSAVPSLPVILEHYIWIPCPSLPCSAPSAKSGEPMNPKLKAKGAMKVELGPMHLRILGRGGPGESSI